MISVGIHYLIPLYREANEMDNMVTERRDEAQTDFIYCCGAITEVLKFGSCRLHSGQKLLFLVIPGEWDYLSAILTILITSCFSHFLKQ